MGEGNWIIMRVFIEGGEVSFMCLSSESEINSKEFVEHSLSVVDPLFASCGL